MTTAIVYAYVTDFEIVGAVLVLLDLFALLAFVADLLATTYGTKRFGASNWGTAGGAIGGLLGTLAGALLFFGVGTLFGLLASTIGSVFAGEYLRRQRQTSSGEGTRTEGPRFGRADWRRVSRAAGGVLVGYFFSAAVERILGLVGVIVFVAALFY